MVNLKYQVNGIIPILFHNIDSMHNKKPPGVKAEEWEKSKECFESYLYKNSAGNLIIPARVLKAALVTAATKDGLKQDGKRSTYKDIIKSMLFVDGDLILDQNHDNLSKNSAFVRIGTSRVLRIRPQLVKWSGKVSLIVADSKTLPTEAVDRFFEYAGRMLGIGDYRPEYGRFEVQRLN